MSLGQSLLMQSLFVSQFIGKFGRKVVLLFSQAKVGKIIILDNLLPSLETPLQYPGGLETASGDNFFKNLCKNKHRFFPVGPLSTPTNGKCSCPLEGK